MALICKVSDSWGLYTQNIFPGKNLKKKILTVRFEKKIFFSLWIAISPDFQMINVKFFCCQKKRFKESWQWLKLLFCYLFTPHNGQLKNTMILTVFCIFSEKLERSLRTIFWYIIEHDWKIFFQYFLGGVTYNVPLEKLKKDQKMLTFWMFIKFKNENMKPWLKMSDQNDFNKIFEFWPIFPLFWSKKSSLKIWSYGCLNEASRQDKFIGRYEKCFKGM